LCPYCDFTVKIRSKIPEQSYTDRICQEIEKGAESWQDIDFQSLYLGGGTPSLWSAKSLARVFETVQSRLKTDFSEITIEANPQDIHEDTLRGWKALGIDRVSLGVQSFSDSYLQQLGRNHDGDTAKRALELLNVFGFRISADLIFAGPGQSLEMFSKDLDLLSMFVNHLSVYALSVEKNTQFWKRKKNGSLILPDDEAEEAFLDLRDTTLMRAGFERYEVSSFARNVGDRALHNSGYWLGKAYWGLGIGAHSFHWDGAGFFRRSNTKSLKKYGEEDGFSTERVGGDEHWFERLFLIVRTRFWFSLPEIAAEFPDSSRLKIQESADVLDRFCDTWIEKKGEHYRLKACGLDVSDSIGKALVEKIQ